MRFPHLLLCLGLIFHSEVFADSAIVLGQISSHGKTKFASNFLLDKTAGLTLDKGLLILQIQTTNGIRKISGYTRKMAKKDDGPCSALFAMTVKTNSETLFIHYEEHPTNGFCLQEYPYGGEVTITSFDLNERGGALGMGYAELTEVW